KLKCKDTNQSRDSLKMPNQDASDRQRPPSTATQASSESTDETPRPKAASASASPAIAAGFPESEPGYKSGVVALIGRPNAGKSTLLNHLVGEKIAIVSSKPQTTRTRISGVLTRERGQIVFLDTPGIHKPGYMLNRRMMSIVSDALATVDLVLLMVDATE